MQKVFIVAVLIAVVANVASPAWAGYINGNELHKECQSETAYNAGSCINYVLGVVDSAQGPDRGVGGYVFCPPDSVSASQSRDIVKNWLADNPGERRYNAASLVASALSEVWPCK